MSSLPLIGCQNNIQEKGLDLVQQSHATLPTSCASLHNFVQGIHLFHKYQLDTSCTPGPVVGSRDIAGNKTDLYLCLHTADIVVRRDKQ